MTITIAPIRADMIETMIRVNAHPSSPAVSAMKKPQKNMVNQKKCWYIWGMCVMSVMKQDLANGVRNTFMIMQFLWSDGDKDDEFIKGYEYE